MRLHTLLVISSSLVLQTALVHAQTSDSKTTAQAESSANSQLISLDDAIRQTLNRSSRLKSGQENVSAARGERLQSSLLPNPELAAEAENIFGSNGASGLSEAEITLGGEQLIELGGKRAARIEAANSKLTIADLQYTATALDLIQNTTNAWVEAVAATEDLKLAQSQHEIASDVLKSVSKRVSAAAEPAIQKSKSQVALASSRIAQQKAERNLEMALKTLTGMWGEDASAYELDKSDFFVKEKPQFEPEPSVSSNPDVQLLEAGVKAANAVLGVEKSNAVPDLSVGIGVKRSRETDSQALVTGLSIPIPVYNRNQGSIMRAGHEAAMAEYDKSSGLRAINMELLQARNTIETSWLELQTLENEIIPVAQKAFSQANDGYRAGKFPYLDVLDAQRTLSEVRIQRIATLREYHHARAELDRLTGENIKYLSPDGEANDNAQ